MPPGYKRTAAGVIPKDWEERMIGDLFAFKNGLNKAKRYFGTGTPIVNYMDVFECPGLTSGDLRGRVSLTPDEIKNYQVLKGDVLFTRTSETAEEVGVASVMLESPRDTVFSGFVLRARPRDGHLENSYKQFCFAARSVRSQIVSRATYTTRALTNGRSLSAVRIAVPPKIEQRAIAAVLSDVDELIGSLEALIAKKRAIKRAAMQELLTGRTRLPGFGGEWETVMLGQIGEITGAGVNKKRTPNEQPVRLLNYLSVYGERFIVSRHLTQTVTAPERQLRRCAIRAGDVFFTPTSETPGDIGNAAVALDDIPDGVYSYHVVRLRLHVNWDPRFRAYVFDTASFRDQASRMAEGSGTRYVITLPRFRSLTVCIPMDLAEQRAIATILSDMDVEIAALERRLHKTRAIKQGMMQQLLTGSIRLPIPEDGTEDDDVHDA